MKIGYARVSTKDQNIDLQVNALQKAECEKIYQEKVSGASKNRPELDKMVEHLRTGDELYVWKLDRLGRSLKHLIELVLELNERGIIVKGLTDGVDTSTSNGRLFLNVMASFAEYERELIQERTNAGLQAAREKGNIGGRKKGFTKDIISRLIMLRKNYNDPDQTPEEIYKNMKISRATYYRYIKIIEKYSNDELKKMAID